MRRITMTLLAVSLAVAACSTASSSTTRLAGPVTSVQIEIFAGDITIDASASGDEVEIATTTDDDAEPAIDLTGGVLTISDGCDAEGCRVDYVVAIPDGAELDVTTLDGDIVIRDNTGNMSLAAGEGGISLFSVGGDIEAVTDNGNLVGTRLTAATARFTAGTGTIDVSFDSPVSDLVAITGSGNVTAQLDAGVTYSIVAEATGDIDLGIDSDEASTNLVALTTGDGDITVYRQ